MTTKSLSEMSTAELLKQDQKIGSDLDTRDRSWHPVLLKTRKLVRAELERRRARLADMTHPETWERSSIIFD